MFTPAIFSVNVTAVADPKTCRFKFQRILTCMLRWTVMCYDPESAPGDAPFIALARDCRRPG